MNSLFHFPKGIDVFWTVERSIKGKNKKEIGCMFQIFPSLEVIVSGPLEKTFIGQIFSLKNGLSVNVLFMYNGTYWQGLQCLEPRSMDFFIILFRQGINLGIPHGIAQDQVAIIGKNDIPLNIHYGMKCR
tara:strand:- start:36545 stop:36934 length:390 start_codon:yes stop_codon:yes gene_type:complete